MATFSQFKSKYIIEKRESLRGDSLNKNIIKKLVTDPLKNIEKNQRNIDKKIQSDLNIPDDGGKAGQSRIEKELNLNKTDKLKNEISNRKLEQLKKQELLKKQMGTLDDLSDGGNTSNTNVKKNIVKRNTRGSSFKRSNLKYDLTGNKIDDSIKSVRTNRRTINKVYQPNVTQGSGSGTTVSKGSGATTSSSNLNKIVNRRSTNIIDKVFGSGDTKITTSKIPGEGSKIFQQNKISNAISGKTKVDLPKFSQQSINKAKGSSKTFVKPETVNQVKTQTQQPLKGFKQFRADSVTRQGAKNVTKGLVGKASKVLGVAGLALDAGVTFRDTYKRSQAQGHSKQRSIGKSLAKIGGGIVGGALGGTIGSAAGPAGSFVGAGLGYAGGKEFGARAFDKLTTQQGRDELKQSFKNFRKRAMKPVGT